MYILIVAHIRHRGRRGGGVATFRPVENLPSLFASTISCPLYSGMSLCTRPRYIRSTNTQIYHKHNIMLHANTSPLCSTVREHVGVRSIKLYINTCFLLFLYHLWYKMLYLHVTSFYYI